MGLDMYLYKRIDLNYNKEHCDFARETKIIVKNQLHNGLVTNNTYKVNEKDEYNIVDLLQEVGYWRKAYHIDRYIFRQRGIENLWKERYNGNRLCDIAIINARELKELKEVCKEVLKDHDKARLLLQSYENDEDGYDDYYFFNTEETVKIIEKIENDEDASFIYEVSY